MDLALELGQPIEVLARTMTEREFRLWALYAKRKLLPTRRMEVYLAQVAQVIAAAMGGAKQVSISDYLIRMDYQEPAEVIDIEEVRKAFGYNPARNRRKRKD
jgi:hypothetical protein